MCIRDRRSTFQAVCQAEGFPRPVINWRRVGISLPAGRTEVNRGILTIKNMILADSGLYECIATNTMGTKKVRTNVVVQRKPGELLLPYWYLISCFSQLWKNHEIIDPCWIKVPAKFKRGKLNANLENSSHRKKKEQLLITTTYTLPDTCVDKYRQVISWFYSFGSFHSVIVSSVVK